MSEKSNVKHEHTLLVSPLGLSKGLLYSALMKTKSDECLVIGSTQSLVALDEIRQKAGYSYPIHTKVMKDPFIGFGETKGILQEIESLLVNADGIVCNITGGTTAQQFVIQAIYEKAKKLGKRVHRIALVDRRDVTEQRNNPYVTGEMVELEE